jgi:hypothetical protein
MRTPLTIDQDILDTARKVARQLNSPFRHVVNEALRIGLREVEKPVLTKPYRTVPHDMGLRGGSTVRSFYVCHFQGNYKENERVSQASQLR